MSFFEQAVECPARIIFGSSGASSSPARLDRCEEIAEVRFFAVGYPLRVRLAAAVAECGFVVRAVNAGVKIGPALVTLISPADKSLDLNLSAAMMTIHTRPTPRCDPSLLQYFTRVFLKNKVEFVLPGWTPLFPPVASYSRRVRICEVRNAPLRPKVINI